MEDSVTDEEIPNFARQEPENMTPVKFKVDGELFECAPVGMLPAGATRDLASLARADKNQQVILFGSFIDAVMMPESAARFAQRLRDPQNPVLNRQISEIIVFLIRTYGDRPTVPVSSSVNGAGTGGTP